MKGFPRSLVLAGVSVGLIAGPAFACGGGSSGGCGGHASHAGHQRDKDMHQHDAAAKQGDAADTEQFLRHGGRLARTAEHNFEIVSAPDGIRVYAYSADLAPALVEGAAGKVTLSFADGSERELALVAGPARPDEKILYFCPMHPNVAQMSPGTCPLCGGMDLRPQDRLFAATDLSRIDPGSAYAVFEITGLTGSEAKVTYAETVRWSDDPVEAVASPEPSSEDRSGHSGHRQAVDF